jgi:thiol-disulfide isomerase/thioredoxin
LIVNTLKQGKILEISNRFHQKICSNPIQTMISKNLFIQHRNSTDMIYTRTALCMLLLTYADSPLIAQQNNTTLVRGDQAPSIKIMKWLRGSGIKEFKKGRVYVMEFGGVDCAPCRMSIPHLSELNKKYKDRATIISVFIYENGTQHVDTISTVYMQRVSKFVRKMGNQISYTVGVDDPKQFMATAWMRAAGLNGIPEAFVIDQTGIIAWIGHPMDLDSILYKIVNKTFDLKKIVLLKVLSWKKNKNITQRQLE